MPDFRRSRSIFGQIWPGFHVATTLLRDVPVDCVMAEEGMRMRSIVMGLAICLGLAAAAAAQDAKVAKGEKVFADQKCALCHSVGEKGNKKGPLDTMVAKLSASEIREWITDAKGMTAKTKADRKPEMKQYTLSKDDVDLLVAYVLSLKK